MSFTESVKTCFNKYVTFKGRATRSEYWWFTICATVLIILLPLLVFALFNVEAMLFAYAATVFAVFLPMWSVTVRRLHDTNHSGWWMLCPVYPSILMFIKGSEGENDYGIGENQLQLPCPICSELVDASVSVCPYCGEATHFDFVEPASGTDRKVAIGVLVLCGLLLIGGIVSGFRGTGISEGLDDIELASDTLDVDISVDDIDDIDYPEIELNDIDSDEGDTEMDDEFKVLSERKLSESDLYGMSKKELEIMRNCIYARHGYRFRRDDLLEFFSQFSWYHPATSDASAVYNEMSDIERYNVEFIKKHE